MDLAKIEERIDRTEMSGIVISESLGGVQLENMVQVMEVAKLMALSKQAVPPHLRGEPGMCFAVCIQALEWKMSPFSVANKSYVVNDRVAFESQLIHAVIEARAPLKGRLRGTYSGDGPDLVCSISGMLEGEAEPLVYDSPKIKDIKVKNSPLWSSDPRQQLWFYSTRAWARKYCPDILLGLFSKDELEDSEIGPDRARDITPINLKERLHAGRKEGSKGFSGDNVDRALEHKPAVPFDAGATKQPEPVTIDNTAPAAEAQMELSAGDVETELAAKKQAIDRVESKADLLAIVATVTDFLKANKRTDLLGDFLTYADRRGKKLKDAA